MGDTRHFFRLRLYFLASFLILQLVLGLVISSLRALMVSNLASEGPLHLRNGVAKDN